MGIISSIATTIMIICFLVFWIKKDLKKSIIFLIISLLLLILSVYINNGENQGTIRSIFGVTSTLLIPIGILFSWSGNKKENIKSIFKIITISILMFLITFLFGLKFKSNENHKYYDKHGKVHFSEEERDEANFVYDMYGAAYDN